MSICWGCIDSVNHHGILRLCMLANFIGSVTCCSDEPAHCFCPALLAYMMIWSLANRQGSMVELDLTREVPQDSAPFSTLEHCFQLSIESQSSEISPCLNWWIPVYGQFNKSEQCISHLHSSVHTWPNSQHCLRCACSYNQFRLVDVYALLTLVNT